MKNVVSFYLGGVAVYLILIGLHHGLRTKFTLLDPNFKLFLSFTNFD